MYHTIKWNGDSISILDQRKLPLKEEYNSYNDYPAVAQAIIDMETRGAPAIGITAAMGIALAAKNSTASKIDVFKSEMSEVMKVFENTRPTAVNLFAAIDRMAELIKTASDIEAAKKSLEEEALAIYEEDIAANKAMGKNGSKFIRDGDTVMTHCNAGALATGGYGTALGVIRAAIEEGKNIEVIACETRPYLQGARLTTWELYKDKIPVTLITDNMSGHFMKEGKIDKIVVGADRIARNGDTANKIGTYSHSVLAKEHGIPFYIAAPLTTLDPDTASGKDIIIEERSIDEVAFVGREQIAPEGIKILNPAFDVTPAENIAAIITERGVIEKPGDKGIMEIYEK